MALTTTAGRLRKNRGAAPLQSLFWRLPWLRSALLLTPPLGWFVLIYLSSLVLLLITAFWTIDTFTTQIVQVWSLDNFTLILNEPAYRLIIGRTVGLAAVVTITDAVLAFPFANIGYTIPAMWIVFSYIWLPFMIIPTYAALERVPESLLEAAADLGAPRWRAILDVVLPLAIPGVVAGSIFTFSLTLGDYITPILVGGAGSTFIGNVVYSSVGIANNVPFAAALAMVPVAIMAVYLLIARRLGAFEAL